MIYGWIFIGLFSGIGLACRADRDSIIWVWYTGIGLVYALVFSVSFFIYGIRIAILLHREQDTKKLRFTSFVILANTCFIVNIVILILLWVGMIIGWDYLGVLIGLYRDFCIDAGQSILITVLIYVSFRKRHHLLFYNACMKCLAKKCNHTKPLQQERILLQSKSHIFYESM